MNPIRWMQARANDERGVAMVVAVILSGVVATLGVLMLTVGTHTQQSSTRGRHFVQALHVAESGIEQAMQKIEESGGNLGSTTFSGATEVGNYDVTITKQPRNRYLIESTGGVREGRVLGAERTIRVQLEPPLNFDKALFSFTTVETKNNDLIEGDVWANHNAVMESGTHVTGSIVAATGYVVLKNGSIVNGDVISGGFDPAVGRAVHLQSNARVDGNVDSTVVPANCVGADNADYKVRVEGTASVGGNVRSWGSLTGGGAVAGTITPNVCLASPATKSLPTFTYSSSLYDPATLHEFGTPGSPSATAVSAFQTYVNGQGKRIEGTFYINQASPVGQSNRVDLTGVTITGDTTIITNTPVFSNGTTDDTADAIFAVISTYRPPTGSTCDVNQDSSECSVHLKNNFNTSGATAVMVFSPYGPAAVKNNAEQYGAIYADSIQVKNNQTMYYDERVAQIVGFSPVTYEITSWQELSV